MPPRSPHTYTAPDPLADLLDGLPDDAPVYTIKTTGDIPARLYGGNAQEVEVRGLDYTLHLDLQKLPESEAPTVNDGKWTVVWDETANQYKRVEFTALPGGVGPPGVAGPQGVPGPAGPQGGVVGPGHIGGLANVSNSRAEAILTEFGADVKVVQLLGAHTPGDAGPPMPCKRTNGPVTLHAGWFRSIDRYKLDGTTDATNGGYWEYISDNQPIWIEWFGGKADYKVPDPGNLKGDWLINPTPTDNYAPIMAAIDFVYSHIKHANATQPQYPLWASGGKIQLAYGQYYCTQTIVPTRTVEICGFGGYGSAPITWLRFPDNVTAFRFESNYGEKAPSAATSVLRDFCIRPVSDGGSTDVTKHGIIMNTALEISHMNIECFGGNGIHIETNAEFGHTNANCFYIHHCYINFCGGHGVYTKDADSNAGVGFALNIVACGRLLADGYGIYDGCFLANSWFACHTAGCGRWDGTFHGGAYYALES